jgi:hypothetical protein
MNLTAKRIIIILVHGFVIWLLCGATIGIGRSLMQMQTVLLVHAIGAPIFAAFVSLIYFRNFNYTNALQTAVFFLLFVMILDAGLVAPFIEKSFEMFRSFQGTWIPFTLIFLSTYITGKISIHSITGNRD